MRKVVLTLAEVVFAGAIAVGVGMIFLPAGLIVAGVMGVFWAERSSK